MMDEGEGEDEDGNDDDDDDADDADAAAHAADDSDYARDDIYDHVTYKLTDTVDAHVIAELQTNSVGCRSFGVQRPIPSTSWWRASSCAPASPATWRTLCTSWVQHFLNGWGKRPGPNL